MTGQKVIVIVLKSGGDFSYRDVELITRHINGRWQSPDRPRIICLWDKASQVYDLGHFEIHPMLIVGDGVWSKIYLFSPEMEKYRPFLYVDLDTAILTSLENIFDLVEDPTEFITLEDFWQAGDLATGMMWVPAKSKKVQTIWAAYKGKTGRRMDRFIRSVTQADRYWQSLTNIIVDGKPRKTGVLKEATEGIICFHGKPRIYDATHIEWIRKYVNTHYAFGLHSEKSVSVIIPYNKDRGWLKDAVASVPANVQLLLSKGDQNWPENFNRALLDATGKYIRWLHEDDMLTPNSIEEAVAAIEEQDVDFIHGDAWEMYMNTGRAYTRYTPPITHPTATQLKQKNVLHSATMLYRREVFEQVGEMREGLEAAEEFEFNLRCLNQGMKIGYCEAPLAFYRRHKEQKIRTIPLGMLKKQREYIRSLH